MKHYEKIKIDYGSVDLLFKGRFDDHVSITRKKSSESGAETAQKAYYKRLDQTL